MSYNFEIQRVDDYANLLQKEYQDYLTNGVPVEKDIVKIANGDEKEATAQRAMDISDKSFDNAALQTNQQLARYGIRLNQNQRTAKAREYGMAKLLSRVNSANNTRVAESERQGQARDMALNLGTGLYASSLGKMGYAAQGALNEISFQEQKKAEEKARKSQLYGNAAIAGAMLLVSDEALKKGVRDNDTSASLKTIRAMRTKKYEYKDQDDLPAGERTGVLHQEAPDSIKAVSDDGVKGVNVGDWVGELTGAVQELAAQQDQMRVGMKKLLKRA